MPRDLIPQPTAPLNVELLLSSGAIEGTPRWSFWRELWVLLTAPCPWGGV